MKGKFYAEMRIVNVGARSPQAPPLSAVANDTKGTVNFKEFAEDFRLTLVRTARLVLTEEQARGFPQKDFITTVDRKKGKYIENVNTFGRIEFEAPMEAGKLVREIMNGLLQRSPVRTGDYRSSFQIRLNNTVVAESGNLTNFYARLDSGQVRLKEGDLFTFVNVAPYARKLERWGVTSSGVKRDDKRRTRKSRDKQGRSEGKRILSEQGVFYLTHKSVQRRFKNIASLRFTLISGSSLGGSIAKATFKTHRGQGHGALRGAEKKNPRSYVYPAIVWKVEYGKGIL